LSVIHASTDAAIILRNNGGFALFDNGAGGASGGASSFSVANSTRHVELNYAFTSFADTSLVSFNAIVDGNLVTTQNFDWIGNLGVLNLELSGVAAGNRIDNFAITTIPEPTAMTLLLGGLGMVLTSRRLRCAQA